MGKVIAALVQAGRRVCPVCGRRPCWCYATVMPRTVRMVRTEKDGV